MKIVVNGAWHEIVPAAVPTPAPGPASTPTLERVLTQLGFTSRSIATALNGEFIAVGQRDGTLVRDGDRLEVVAPMQGG